MLSSNKLKVKFLDDTPTSQDEIKLHSKIASTLAKILNIIEKNEKKIIALFGSWGSGKSTVIKILEKEIGESKIFIFDSWSHKGDFLKRAFLLELAKSLEVEKEEYVKDNNKDKITIETVLTRKVINKTVDSKPLSDLNKPVKILTGLILFSIIFAAFSKITEYLVALWNPVELISELNFSKKSQWITGITIFLIVLGICIWQRKKINEILTNFINFYFLKKVEITESHTTKEDLEFTNYDYENYLNYILNKAAINEKKPLIIVFDNLDRVDDETVINTFSLIQLTSESLEKKGFKDVYFLIPIDKERLEKTIKTIIVENNNDESEKEKFAKDFLEKIFPYKVEIPNIYHSDWRTFFNRRIKESMPFLDENVVREIRLLFEEGTTIDKLTPREIKNFINNLVENYIFWGESIDIRLQALFVVLHRSGKKTTDPPEGLMLILESSFSRNEIKHALLKQKYKVNRVPDVFIEESIKHINEKKVKEFNNVLKEIEDKEKINTFLWEIWKRKINDMKQDVNSLLKFSFMLRETIKKEDKYKDIYENNFKNNIYETLKTIIKQPEKIAEIEEIQELSEILKEREDIRKVFIEKSAEIVISITEEKKNVEG